MKRKYLEKLAVPIAIITCPCHLFILAAVLAGTAAGAFINDYFIPLVILFSILFVISLMKAMKNYEK